MSQESFQRVLEKRNDLLHDKAIWEEVREHLGRFLDTDTSPAKHGISTKGEGLVVPQPRIEQVIAYIQSNHLDTIDQELQYIDQGKVTDHVKPDPREESRKATPAKNGKVEGKRRRKKTQPKAAGNGS